jgi:hypothetical protein
MTELQAKLAPLSIFKEPDAAELTLLAERRQWFRVMGREQRIFSSYPIVRKVVPRERFWSARARSVLCSAGK